MPEEKRTTTIDELERRLEEGESFDIHPDGRVVVRPRPVEVLDVVAAARALGPTNY